VSVTPGRPVGRHAKETDVTETTSLVELVARDDAPLLARRFYGDGPPSPITASLAQAPELLDVTLPFIGAALGPGALDARTKELAILRTSALLSAGTACRRTRSSRWTAA
jgi:hypothetical protein